MKGGLHIAIVDAHERAFSALVFIEFTLEHVAYEELDLNICI